MLKLAHMDWCMDPSMHARAQHERDAQRDYNGGGIFTICGFCDMQVNDLHSDEF